MAIISTPKGATLVLNDLVGNIRDAVGFGGWLLHVAGFAGEQAQVPKVVKMAIIEDTNALRAHLLQWVQIESLKCVLVSHGAPIQKNPQQVLRERADSLI